MVDAQFYVRFQLRIESLARSLSFARITAGKIRQLTGGGQTDFVARDLCRRLGDVRLRQVFHQTRMGSRIRRPRTGSRLGALGTRACILDTARRTPSGRSRARTCRCS